MAIFQILLIAFTIFSEALHESITGKLAVASVIENRYDKIVKKDSTKTYADIILKPKQFSCYNEWILIQGNMKKIEKRNLDFMISLIIAVHMYDNNFRPTIKSSHYVMKGVKKSWMKDMEVECEIDNHQYLLEKEDK